MAASAPRDPIDQGLDFVGRTFAAQETKDNADGFVSDSIIVAGLCGPPSHQFVQICPASARYLAGFCRFLDCGLILSVCDLNYKR